MQFPHLGLLGPGLLACLDLVMGAMHSPIWACLDLVLKMMEEVVYSNSP